MNLQPIPVGLGAVLLSMPLYAGNESAQDAAREEAVLAILATRQANDGPSASQLQAQLVGLGPGHAETVIGLLILPPGQDGSLSGGDDVPPDIIDDEDRSVLAAALKVWPEASVFAAAYKVAQANTNSTSRVEVARVVSEMETSSTMRPVLRILGTVEGPHFKSAYLSRLAGDCIRRSLDSDSRAWLALQRDLGGLDVEVLGCVADCLAGGLTVHERQLQIDLLGRDVALDTRILANFLKLELRASRRMRELAVTRVVDLAESPSKVVRKLALLVLGHWREADSIHLMIANLEHEQRSVSRAALTALRQVSGLSWPGDAERWRNWHTEQLSWLAEASPDLRERITSDDLSVSMRACRDLGLHGLWRAHLVPVVASTLEQVDVPVVIASIEALQELDAFGAIAVLIPMLDDSNEKVQFAAQAALESITANALDPSRSGADSSAWWSWLEG